MFISKLFETFSSILALKISFKVHAPSADEDHVLRGLGGLCFVSASGPALKLKTVKCHSHQTML